MNIDYHLLRKQKQTLNELIAEQSLTPEHQEDLTGLVNFIDDLQDEATDELGVPEAEVFGESIDE